MFSLVKTEWLKISRYPAFWLLTGLCILSYPGINYISLNIFKKTCLNHFLHRIAGS